MLRIARALLNLAFSLLGQTFGLLARAADHLPSLFLHLAGGVLDRTLDLILVHELFLELVERTAGSGPPNRLTSWREKFTSSRTTIRCDLSPNKLRRCAGNSIALDQRSGAHSVPLMQIMDGRSLGSIVQRAQALKEKLMSLGTLLLIVLILMLVGAIPTWPHSKSWGYAPSGVLGLVVVIIIVLLL